MESSSADKLSNVSSKSDTLVSIYERKKSFWEFKLSSTREFSNLSRRSSEKSKKSLLSYQIIPEKSGLAL